MDSSFQGSWAEVEELIDVDSAVGLLYQAALDRALCGTTLSSCIGCVHKNLSLEKLKGTKGMHKSSTPLKIWLDICCTYEINYL